MKGQRTSPKGSMLPTRITGLPRLINIKLSAEAVYLGRVLQKCTAGRKETPHAIVSVP